MAGAADPNVVYSSQGITGYAYRTYSEKREPRSASPLFEPCFPHRMCSGYGTI